MENFSIDDLQWEQVTYKFIRLSGGETWLRGTFFKNRANLTKKKTEKVIVQISLKEKRDYSCIHK